MKLCWGYPSYPSENIEVSEINFPGMWGWRIFNIFHSKLNTETKPSQNWGSTPLIWRPFGSLSFYSLHISLVGHWRCLSSFPRVETRFNTHYQNAYANAFRNAFLELLRLSSSSIASTSREQGLVTAQLHCAVWPVEQRSCRAHA